MGGRAAFMESLKGRQRRLVIGDGTVARPIANSDPFSIIVPLALSSHPCYNYL
jgi:hypothetical protein